ncbi:MAG TPA: type II secretion system F family protein [Ilumatobacter sp.]|nr:type II secretion system F family protein [Ilumatobacter sp.]
MIALLAMVLAGCLAGTGLLLVIRGAMSPAPRLGDVVAELHRPRSAVPPTRRQRLDTSFERFALFGLHGRSTDLAVCERSPAEFAQDRLVWALLGASAGLLAVAARPLGLTWVSVPVGLAFSLVGGVAGWFYALVDLRSDAVKARREFVTSLASYLELVAILMAGGAGVETALHEAGLIGRGRGYRQIRAALSAAQARRQGPWQEFGALGRRLGVQELQDLEAAMTLASDEGARVRESLANRAAALRERDVYEQEAEAQSKSETMVLPVAAMFAGFILLVGWPAIAGLSAP